MIESVYALRTGGGRQWHPGNATRSTTVRATRRYLFWSVQVFASYDADILHQYDSVVDTSVIFGATSGSLSGNPKKISTMIHLETIRDRANNAPFADAGRPIASESQIIERVVFHELLHVFNMSHAMPGNEKNPWEDGVMDSKTTVFGTDADNAITPTQIAKIKEGWLEP